MAGLPQFPVPVTDTMRTTPAALYLLVREGARNRRFPRFVVAFTGAERTAPVVFYEVASEDSYHRLQRFLDRHLDWEIATGWSRRRFHSYLSERLKQGLATPYFRETNRGWLRVAQTRRPTSAAPKEDTLFTPQTS